MAKLMDTSREDLLDCLRPECAVCLLPYDDGARTPRLLSCGHSISQDCADQLIDLNYSPAGGEASVGFGVLPRNNAAASSPSIPPEGLSKIVGARFGVVKCPECNQRTKVPAKGARGLAKNIELLRVISKLQGNDGSAKARKADLERHVNWAKEMEAQEAVARGGAASPQALAEAADTGRLHEEPDSIRRSPEGAGSARGLHAVSRSEVGPSTLQSESAVGGTEARQQNDAPEIASAEVETLQVEESQSSSHREPSRLDIAQTPQSNEDAPHSAAGRSGESSDSVADEEQRPLTQLRSVQLGHLDSVSALAVVADQWLCSASFDRSVRVWSVADGSPHGVLEGHQHRIMALATVSLLPEESNGIDEDGIVCGNGRIIDNYLSGADERASIPKGADLLVSADYGGHIKVWSVLRDTSVVRGPGESPPGEEEKPAVFPGEPCPGPGKLLAAWDAHADWKYFGILALAVADGKVLYSGAGDRTIRAWSLGAGGVALGGLLGVLEGHTGPVSALAVDGELLYSGSWDGSVHGWWRDDLTPVAVVHAGPGPGVRCLSMVGPRLIAGREDGTLQAWVEGQPESERAKAHGGVVSCLCVCGPYLYTGSWDGIIQVWHKDAAFGAEGAVASIRVEGGPLAVVHALTAARGQLFSAHMDTGIKVWTRASV